MFKLQMILISHLYGQFSHRREIMELSLISFFTTPSVTHSVLLKRFMCHCSILVAMCNISETRSSLKGKDLGNSRPAS